MGTKYNGLNEEEWVWGKVGIRWVSFRAGELARTLPDSQGNVREGRCQEQAQGAGVTEKVTGIRSQLSPSCPRRVRTVRQEGPRPRAEDKGPEKDKKPWPGGGGDREGGVKMGDMSNSIQD